jgi:tripartite-type tricarboxylate transporter receptor subunit TctC
VKDKPVGFGYDLVGGTPEHFAAFVRNEIKKWADVVRRTGAKVE